MSSVEIAEQVSPPMSPVTFLTLALPREKDCSLAQPEMNNNAVRSSTELSQNIGSSGISSPLSPVENYGNRIPNGCWPKHAIVPNLRIGYNQPGTVKQKAPDSKLVILGNPAVGKSALVVRFLTRRFIWEYDPTLECVYRYCGIIDDEQTCIDILDTAGQGDISNQEGNIRWAEGFMLVYSVTDRMSFEVISTLHQAILSVRPLPNVSCVLVGNKNDMTHERQVTSVEGEQLAMDLGCLFYEVSACDGNKELYEAFLELHRDVRRRIAVGRRRRSSAQQVIQALNKMFTKMNG